MVPLANSFGKKSLSHHLSAILPIKMVLAFFLWVMSPQNHLIRKISADKMDRVRYPKTSPWQLIDSEPEARKLSYSAAGRVPLIARQGRATLGFSMA